ncbi:MAG: HDOD domain-containing protein [Acidimicrobiia bacterium]|nr:HDOD domain-containing protein [Acidimicrobiia bacterium]
MAPASTAAPARTAWTDWMRSGAWKDGTDTAIPMLPASAQEIVSLALDPEVAVAPIVAIISRDPVLATRVIQLANSAFSASSKEIASINEAVVRLGTGLVRTVMTSTCLSALATDPQIYGRRGRDYIDHSVGTAYLAWLIAENAGEHPPEAFLYGLLHDVGKLLVIKLARQAERYGVVPPAEEDLVEVMGEQHAELGGYLLRQWGLPARLHDAVVFHHAPEQAVDRPQAAAVNYAANRLAHRYGFACLMDDFDPLTDPVFQKLRLDANAVARLDLQAPVLFELARKVRH